MYDDGIAIKVEDVSAGYDSADVLRNVSFSVRKGEMVGIIGPNGAGKSTLLKTMQNIIPVLSGKILFGGRELSTIEPKEFAHISSYLQQSSNIPFAYKVKDVVMAGRYCHLSWWQREGEQDREIVEAAMRYTGVDSFADRLMNDLSGGQKQRAMLAKVLAQQAPIMLLDEPATGLDIIYQEELFAFCRELCQAGKTVVMVAHELSLAARFCTRLIMAANGGIVADGLPDEVLQEKVLAIAYGDTIKVSRNDKTGHADIYAEPKSPMEGRREWLAKLIGREETHG